MVAIKADFHFSHYKSMATGSCHSNRSSYPIATKNTTVRFPGLYMLHVKFGQNREEMLFENVDRRRTDEE